jgi:Xaa-Pro dipeptidase
MANPNSERIYRLKQGMEEAGIDVMILRLPENVLFASGYWSMFGWTFLVFPRKGKATCIIGNTEEQEADEDLWDAKIQVYPAGTLESGNPYTETGRILSNLLKRSGWEKVGYEADFESVAAPWNAAEPAVAAASTHVLLKEIFADSRLVDVTAFLNEQRSQKTEFEIAQLRTVNEISTAGLQIFYEKAVPGVSGVELVADVERSIMIEGPNRGGAKRVRAFAQVSTGRKETSIGYRPMVISTKAALRDGDIALLELGVVADGYWCDRTRVRVAGTPSAKQKEIFNLIKSAQEAAVAKSGPGVTAGEVDEAARSIIREGGYEKAFVHVTGHGLGFRYHEPVPLICPGSELVLLTGMVHTVEPGIYKKGIGGMRLEDNVVVTETGREVLGPFEKTLSL